MADRIRVAVEEAVGRGGAHPAALTALLGWANRSTVDGLARGLGLSHSRTVRVVDGLVEQGWVRRSEDPFDGRHVLVELTDEGFSAANSVLAARAGALDELLSRIPPAQRSALADAASSILSEAVHDCADARIICRLCDLHACGFAEGHCPATPATDAVER